MPKNVNWWSRKLHRWGAVGFAIPMMIVITSGLLLQLKKELHWIQPPTQKGSAPDRLTTLSVADIVDAASADPASGIASWEDVKRIDVQLSKGVAKLQGPDNVEVQVDLADGSVLQVATRRSDVIESLHDGSFFADFAKLWIFLPSGIALFGLWLTGAWLWLLPFKAKSKRKQRKETS